MSNKSFRDKTHDTMVECGEWFKKNADDLANIIAEGCTSWRITFTWITGTDYSDPMPEINIDIDKIDRDIICAARGCKKE